MIIKNIFFFGVGILLLLLVKIKNKIEGYTTPKPFSVANANKCIEYDMRVVDNWSKRLHDYVGKDDSLSGKNILELGPGSDLGIGIYLLLKGCAQYNACDVNKLMEKTPDSFYQKLFDTISRIDTNNKIEDLKNEFNNFKSGKRSKLNYVVDEKFDFLTAFGKESQDIVFSQAAFEHFDDIESTLQQLNVVCKPDAVLIAEVDLKTHTRWICNKDPNNIYRYSDKTYQKLWFRGIPNRIRPYQYKNMLEKTGWSDVKILPLGKIINNKIAYSGVNRQFRDEINQMEYLSIVLCARKTRTII